MFHRSGQCADIPTLTSANASRRGLVAEMDSDKAGILDKGATITATKIVAMESGVVRP